MKAPAGADTHRYTVALQSWWSPKKTTAPSTLNHCAAGCVCGDGSQHVYVREEEWAVVYREVR